MRGEINIYSNNSLKVTELPLQIQTPKKNEILSVTLKPTLRETLNLPLSISSVKSVKTPLNTNSMRFEKSPMKDFSKEKKLSALKSTETLTIRLDPTRKKLSSNEIITSREREKRTNPVTANFKSPTNLKLVKQVEVDTNLMTTNCTLNGTTKEDSKIIFKSANKAVGRERSPMTVKKIFIGQSYSSQASTSKPRVGVQDNPIKFRQNKKVGSSSTKNKFTSKIVNLSELKSVEVNISPVEIEIKESSLKDENQVLIEGDLHI
jgi:hypothetical protein